MCQQQQQWRCGAGAVVAVLVAIIELLWLRGLREHGTLTLVVGLAVAVSIAMM